MLRNKVVPLGNQFAGSSVTLTIRLTNTATAVTIKIKKPGAAVLTPTPTIVADTDSLVYEATIDTDDVGTYNVEWTVTWGGSGYTTLGYGTFLGIAGVDVS